MHIRVRSLFPLTDAHARETVGIVVSLLFFFSFFLAVIRRSVYVAIAESYPRLYLTGALSLSTDGA